MANFSKVKILFVIFTTILMFLSLTLTRIHATEGISAEILSSNDDVIEILLNKNTGGYLPVGQVNLDVEYSSGLGYLSFEPREGMVVDVTTSDGAISIARDHDGGEVKDGALGVLRLSRSDQSDQFIRVIDRSAEDVSVSSYYKIPSTSDPIEILKGIDIREFLGWLAVMIALTLGVMLYILATSYLETVTAQQYLLFGFIGVIVCSLVLVVLPFIKLPSTAEKAVMGLELVSYEEEHEQSIDGSVFSDGMCDLPEYSAFLEDYLMFERQNIVSDKSDLSQNGVIDNIDLKLFVNCMEYGR